MAGLTAGGPAGGGHAQPQFRLVHDRLRLALPARMAGPSVYFGALVGKPWLGPSRESAAPWDRARLLALCALMRYSALYGGLSLWLACLLLRFFFA